MRIQDIFVFAFNALRDRKLRTVLTLLGIAIGPAAIVALIGATEGFSHGLTAQFEKVGANTMQVMPMGRSATISAQDVKSIQSITGVQYVIPFYRTDVELKYGGTSVSTSVIALDTSTLGILFPGIEVYEGRMPEASEFTSAIAGYSVANPPDPEVSPLSLNQVVTTSTRQMFGGQTSSGGGSTTSRSFLVSGVLTEFGQGLFVNPDDSLFISLEAGRLITGSSYYSGLYVLASDADAVSQVQEAISNMYSDSVRVVTISTFLSTIQSVTGSMTTMLASIASISVAVAFMGIMTTMFTSVNERTREIGVTKALGYSSRTVMLFFLAEATLTGLLGGVVGSISGAILSNFITSLFGGGLRFGTPMGGGPMGGTRSVQQQATTALQITPVVTPELMLGAILLATIVGALAGIIPAWRASRLTPVEALRHT